LDSLYVGMPRTVRFFQLVSDKVLEEATLEDLRSRGEASTRLARRVVELMESFYDETEDEQLTGAERMLRFKAKLRRAYPNAATRDNLLKAIEAGGLAFEKDGSLDAAALRARLEERAVDAGLRQEKRMQPLPERAGSCSYSEILAILQVFPGDTNKDDAMRRFYFMCVVTGCRPHHLRLALRHSVENPEDPSIRFEEGALVIRWGMRKIRSATRAFLRYPLGWSTIGWPDLREWVGHLDAKRLKELESHLPSVRKSDQTAAILTQWIAKRSTSCGLADAVRPTSTSGRCLLSGTLAVAVREGNLCPSDFENLMDHTLDTSFHRYQVGLVVDTSRTNNRGHEARRERTGKPE
jgi:hypothetical protein